jgi:hypothetical protein
MKAVSGMSRVLCIFLLFFLMATAACFVEDCPYLNVYIPSNGDSLVPADET